MNREISFIPLPSANVVASYRSRSMEIPTSFSITNERNVRIIEFQIYIYPKADGIINERVKSRSDATVN